MNDSTKTITEAQVARLDAADPLAGRRELFALPEGVIYLDGNSLGALPKSVMGRMTRAIEQEWGVGLIRSWNDADWYPAPQRVGGRIATLIGAHADEVIVADSTSVNLFKVLVAALRMRPGRKRIVGERGNFPTDVYVASGVAELMNAELVTVEPDDVMAAIDAVRHGRHHAPRARRRRPGGLGSVPHGGRHALRPEWLRRRFRRRLWLQVLQRWSGRAGLRVRGAAPSGAGAPAADRLAWPCAAVRVHARLRTGDGDALEQALQAFDGVDMQQLRRKSEQMTDLFIRLVEQELAPYGFGLASPRDAAQRGSQVSLTHAEGYAIMQALIARGVIGDFRAPEILRFGFAVLYVSFRDVWNAVAIIKDVMATGAWKAPEFSERKAVT